MEWQDYPTGDGGEHTVSGTVRVLPGVRSPQLENQRDIYAYLPPSYASGERRYPVIYMQDGQNLFDAAISFNNTEWRVDEVMEEASRERGLEAIVIGIPNMGEERLDEYSPFRDEHHGGGYGDDYVDFLVDTLKPIVDGTLRTESGRESTAVVGSSMGGLISLYAFFRHPERFGSVGAMSPALWFAERAIYRYLEEAPLNPGRVYLDVGTHEGTRVVRDVRRARALLRRKGYEPGRTLVYVQEEGAGHHEEAWSRRLREALPFLLGAPVDAAMRA